MKSFNERAYDLLKTVPRGKVTTYKAMAKALGTRGYRAVGNAMNKNPYDTEEYPCHRVVSASGKITGYAYGCEKKAKRLESEGVEIIRIGRNSENWKVKDFESKFFDFNV